MDLTNQDQKSNDYKSRLTRNNHKRKPADSKNHIFFDENCGIVNKNKKSKKEIKKKLEPKIDNNKKNKRTGKSGGGNAGGNQPDQPDQPDQHDQHDQHDNKVAKVAVTRDKNMNEKDVEDVSLVLGKMERQAETAEILSRIIKARNEPPK